MQTDPISPNDIRFNAASGTFEACVTLHCANSSRVYACSINGALSMSLEDAAKALRTEAVRRHSDAPGLYTAPAALAPTPMRAATRADWRDTLMNVLPGTRGLRAA